MLKLRQSDFRHIIRRLDILEKAITLGKVRGSSKRGGWMDSRLKEATGLNLQELRKAVLDWSLKGSPYVGDDLTAPNKNNTIARKKLSIFLFILLCRRNTYAFFLYFARFWDYLLRPESCSFIFAFAELCLWHLASSSSDCHGNSHSCSYAHIGMEQDAGHHKGVTATTS